MLRSHKGVLSLLFSSDLPTTILETRNNGTVFTQLQTKEGLKSYLGNQFCYDYGLRFSFYSLHITKFICKTEGHSVHGTRNVKGWEQAV
jgi:hypothetical protein